MEYNLAIAVLTVAVAGMAAQWLAWRLRLPPIVLLFATGLLAGPVFGVVHPSHDFGPALRLAIGLAVAIVMFEGGLALDLRELRSTGGGVVRLTAVALPLNLGLATAAAYSLTPMGWGPAMLFGAITVVTGPTVVLPLLRTTRLKDRARTFLKWEAIVNDPVGAILAALVLEVLLARGGGGMAHQLAWHLPVQLAAGLLAATALGMAAGLLVRWAFVRDQVPEVLKTPLLLALTLGVYTTSNLVMPEAGLVAATVFGMAVANLRVPGLAELRRAKEALVVLLVSALFVVLTADLDSHILSQLSWPIALLTLAMLVVVRPAAILLALLRSDLTLPERLLAAWIAPRGIVAAAVAGLAGLQLQAAGYEGANLVMPSVFALIAATMILHGFSLGPLARRLDLALAGTPGLAVIGARDWTIDLASALHRIGVPVLLVDTFPGALAPARALGLPVMQAEILSEHGAEELSGRPVDYVFAATADDVYNCMVCAQLAPELGRQRVFQLAGTEGRGRLDRRRGVSRDWRGKVLGEPALDHAAFEERYRQGWRFYIETNGDVTHGTEAGRFLLAQVRGNGALAFPSVEDAAPPAAAPGDRLLVFVAPAASAPPASSVPEGSSRPAGDQVRADLRARTYFLGRAL